MGKKNILNAIQVILNTKLDIAEKNYIRIQPTNSTIKPKKATIDALKETVLKDSSHYKEVIKLPSAFNVPNYNTGIVGDHHLNNVKGTNSLKRDQKEVISLLMELEQNSIDLGRKLITKSLELNKTLRSIELCSDDVVSPENFKSIQDLSHKMQKKTKRLVTLNEGFREEVAAQKVKQFCRITLSGGIKRLHSDNN